MTHKKQFKKIIFIIVDLIVMCLYSFAILCLILYYGFSGSDGSIILGNGFELFVRNYIVPFLFILMPILGVFLNIYIYKKNRKSKGIKKKWLVLVICNVIIIISPIAVYIIPELIWSL